MTILEVHIILPYHQTLIPIRLIVPVIGCFNIIEDTLNVQ